MKCLPQFKIKLLLDNDLHKQIIETLIKYEHLFNVVPVSENDEPVLKNLNNDFAFVWDN